jgi:serine protease AprX
VSISPNLPVSAFVDRATYSADYWPLQQYYDNNGRSKGNAIGVAIVDSGVNAGNTNFNGYHNTQSRIVYSQTFVGGDTNDQFGHGTHVAGIVAGVDNVTSMISNNTRFFSGVAQDSRIINLKVLDANGNGTDASVIAGINAAIKLKATYNIRVINLSLGRPVKQSYKTDPLCQAVESAWKAGIVVVVAAGNNGRDNSQGTGGYGTITAPGNDPYVITVGATNDMGKYDRTLDVIATYSSKGPTAIDHIVKPDLVAPGNRIVSDQSLGCTLAKLYPANQVPVDSYDPAGSASYSPYFFTLSGTSMATPLVSGAAVFMIDLNSAITPDQVKAKLMRTAWRGFPYTMKIPVTDPATGVTTTYVENADLFTMGAGQVDMWAAYNDTTMPAGSAASPSVSVSSNGAVGLKLNSVGATSAIWGSNVVWGSSAIWGTNVSGTNVVWGSGAIWGTSAIWGSNVVWGSSAIWGTSSPWAASTPGPELVTIAINGDN